MEQQCPVQSSPFLPPAPGLLLCQLRALTIAWFTKDSKLSEGSELYFLIHSQRVILRGKKSQETEVQLLVLSLRPCSVMQGFNLSLNWLLQLNWIMKSVCLTSSLAHSQLKQAIFHQYLPVITCWPKMSLYVTTATRGFFSIIIPVDNATTQQLSSLMPLWL